MENLTLDFNNFGSRLSLGTYEKCDSLTLTIMLDEKDYTGYKFKILAKKSDGHIIEQDIKEHDINREEKTIKTELNNQFTTKEGVVKLEINMIKEGKEDTTKEAFFIVRDTINGEVVESASIIPTLEGVKVFIDEAVSSLGDLEQAGKDITLINGEFKEAEIKRKANELLRERSEKERVRLESIRTTEEADRIRAEAERKEAENNRKVAESNRKLNENTRKTNEAARVEAELNRQSLFEENEEIRNENENLRIEAEKERIKFNSEAKTDELNRKESEKNRVLAEEERKSSEEARVSAEAIRQNTYTDFNDSEVERKNNEIKRQEAEALRVEAETRRDNIFAEKEEERNTSFIESEKVRNAAFNKAQDSRNTAFEESETIREEAFKISEKTRNDAEELRVTAESERAKAEKLRVDSEKARVLAEEERNTTFTQKEEERNNTFTQNETNRNETFEVAEEARTVAETSRIESESSRVEAEKLRVAAETERVEAENLRVAAEEGRVAAEIKREEGFNKFEGKINSNTEELKNARSATTGEEFDTLDERIDCEVDRLNKKIEVSMLQQESTESHIVENTVDGMTTDMIIKGRTLQNLMITPVKNKTFTANSTSIKYNYKTLKKKNTKYTLIANVSKNTLNNKFSFIGWKTSNPDNCQVIEAGTTGIVKKVFTTSDSDLEFYLELWAENTEGEIIIDYMMLFEGELTYCPDTYFEGIKSFGQQEDKISILSGGLNRCTNESINGFININVNNAIQSDTTAISYIAKVYKGGTYYLNKIGGDRSVLGYFKSYPKIGDVALNVASGSITVPSHGYIVAYVSSNKNTNNPTNIMISENASIDFQPYQEDKKDILLSEYGFEEGLRGFNLTVCDELNDAKNVAVKRISKTIFNGTENYIYSIEDKVNNWKFGITLADVKPNSTEVICNTFANVTMNRDEENVEGIRLYTHNQTTVELRFTIKKTKLNISGDTPTNEEIKNFFKNNNTEVYYELKEPVETPLNESIALKVLNEKTYVSFENSISGTSSFKAPVNTVATIARLNRENRALEEENVKLKKGTYINTKDISITKEELQATQSAVDFLLLYNLNAVGTAMLYNGKKEGGGSVGAYLAMRIIKGKLKYDAVMKQYGEFKEDIDLILEAEGYGHLITQQ